MVCDWCCMAEIGTPAAMRPITGTDTPLLASSALSAFGAGAAFLPRPPSTTDGEKPRDGECRVGEFASGSLSTSKARALLGNLRMKPRSSNAVIRRWIPDFDRKSSASFISSKDGGTPVSLMRSLMNIRSSCCLRVSIAVSCLETKCQDENQEGHPWHKSRTNIICSCCVLQVKYGMLAFLVCALFCFMTVIEQKLTASARGAFAVRTHIVRVYILTMRLKRVFEFYVFH